MSESNSLQIEIIQDRRVVFSAPFEGIIEIGRQRKNEVDPFAINHESDPPRLIVAPTRELDFSRGHARIEKLGEHFQITNISSKSQIEIRNIPPTGRSQVLDAGESIKVGNPLTLALGNREIRVQASESELVGLPEMTAPPSLFGQSFERTLAGASLFEFRSPDQMDVPELMSWLRNVLDLFQRSPGTDEFFEHSTAVVAQMLKLDSAAILFHENSKWQVRHVYHRNDRVADEWRPSMTILNEVRKNVRAYRQIPSFDENQPQSLMGVDALVAAPILSPESEVIGALYGDKRMGQAGSVGDISEVETMFVELLASGIAAGLARLEKEKEVVQARVRFEQFFPRGLVDKLENDTEFLKGKETEVTVMFCDIRKFSDISERVGPEVTVEFVNDVMQDLSMCVQSHDGVLVDYIGDELIAMWGAPESQPDHATMAARAARDMFRLVPELDDRWRDKIGTDFRVGIGLNSGMAQVGNVGSKMRFKYGPLGNTVNVASRVQGVTKQLKVPLLITHETAERLDDSIPYRKICQVKLVNVTQPVTVCEVPAEADENWAKLKLLYEGALELFEQKSFLEACNQLSTILKEFPNDNPTMKLLSRAVGRMSGDENSEDSTVWVLDSK